MNVKQPDPVAFQLFVNRSANLRGGGHQEVEDFVKFLLSSRVEDLGMIA